MRPLKIINYTRCDYTPTGLYFKFFNHMIPIKKEHTPGKSFWRRWNRILHRDLGYFFVGMTLIYAISGIAINHKKDWDPNTRTTIRNFELSPTNAASVNQDFVNEILKMHEESENYRRHYIKDEVLTILLKERGIIHIDLLSGYGELERKTDRYIFKESNYLHYNPIYTWTIFSDVYAVVLIFLAVGGLFMIKGKKGFAWRGAILGSIGILIPIIYLILYYY